MLPGYTDDVVIQDRVTAYVSAGLGVAPPSGALNTSVARNVPVGSFEAVTVTVTLESPFIIRGPVMRLFSGGAWTSITLTATSTMRCDLGNCT